ncbi:acyltransferase family protein, partial [Streptomyces sp. NRRL WC-3742]|uniref:acyltransferase family protein n=1 Tax=Streptomyces sp. NRRL WC-3742 TaxID=1463934 RepID=UPI00131AA7FD
MLHAPATPPTRQRAHPDPAPAGARLAVLDGMRLIAALAVAGFHYLSAISPALWGPSPKEFAYPLHHASMYGWLGVEAFFLISGFVICMSSWGRTAGQFAASRISRLYPAYWAAVVLIVARIALIPMQTHDVSSVIHPRVVLANLTMFPDALHASLLDGVAWTLAVEAHFYLLMAVLLAFGTTYHRVMGFCVIWLAAALITSETKSKFLDDLVLSQYAGLFVAGIAVYLMYRFGQNLMLWVVLGFAWCYEMAVLPNRLAGHSREWGSQSLCSWTVAAAALTAFLALLLLATVGPLARIRWRWLMTAGALTYPFYLIHQSLGLPMAGELTAHAPWLGPWGRLALTTASMLLLAWIIHRVVEKPLGRTLRRHLDQALTRHPKPPTA